MSVRRLLASVAVSSLAVTTLALAAPAQADPSFLPDATDIVGSGSDTTMYALDHLAHGNAGVPGYNEGRTSGRLVSWDANIYDATGTQVNSTKITPRAGAAEVTRPNGSGQGMTQLMSATNNPAFNYARSSSGLNAAQNAELKAFPFAKDTLAMATAQNSNAPASLSAAQIVQIYKGDVTNWSQLGGSDGVIEPMVPQTGSGTRSFFLGELKKMNGGNDVVLAGSVKAVQEHDDSPVKDDRNAVAPFSVGRAGLLGTLRIEDGWSAARALYNVVRNADAGSQWALDLFGPNGFVCSPAATSLILDAGFEQLLSEANGGSCGVVPATGATSDLATAKVATTTTLAGSSASAGALSVTATIGGGGALKPQGVVKFAVDGVEAANVIVTGGKATLNRTGLTPGAHQVTAVFTSTGAAFSDSEGSTTVNVKAPAPVVAKASTKLVEKYKARYARGAVVKGKVLVTENAAGAATGRLVIKRGAKTVGKGLVKNGVVTIKLKGLVRGKNRLVATYAGDAKFLGSKLKFVITVR